MKDTVLNDYASSLRLLASKTGDLPPLPATAIQALQLTKDPQVSARDMQTVISRDQGLSAKILRIVNSAMYCLSREVSTISHAVTVLGMQTIQSIIMAASIQQVFQNGVSWGKDLGTKLLSDHSWGAAVAAKIVAQNTHYESPEEAFLCGLMHDIGKPVMLKNFTNRYTQIVSDVYREEAHFHEAEMEAFGFSHAHVGAVLAQKWNFPGQLAEAIGYHHHPLAAPVHARLACIISLANAIMILLEVGFERNKNLELEREPAAEYLKLNGAALQILVEEIRAGMSQIPDSMKF